MSAHRPDPAAGLRALIRPQEFERSIRELSVGLGKPEVDATHLVSAVASLRDLPHCLRRLAWFSARSTPRRLRWHSDRDRWRLFTTGIVRSLDGLAPPNAVVDILLAAASLDRGGASEWIANLDRAGAFDTLSPPWGTRDIVSTGVSLFRCTTPAQSSALRSTLRPSTLLGLHEAAGVASWLHYLNDPDAEEPSPLSGDIANETLAMPVLRGLRRSGYRKHGRKIGVAASGARSHQMMQDICIPKALMLTDADRRLTEPLAIDLLSCVVAQRPSSGNRCSDCHDLVAQCPQLVRDAVGLTTRDVGDESEDLEEWVKAVCGVRSIRTVSGFERRPGSVEPLMERSDET